MFRRPELSRSRTAWAWVAIAGLGLLDLWLTSVQPLQVIAGAQHDDLLYVRRAEALTAGQWLGPYDELVLSKGPFYSFWIAAVRAAGVPLLVLQHLLYALACLAVAISVRTVVRGPWALCGLYALVLFNPATFHSELARVVREGIYPALTLLVFAGSIGLWARAHERVGVVLPWLVLLGVSLGAFWLTREESAWVVPPLLILLAAAVSRVLHYPPTTGRWPQLALMALAPGLALGSVDTVAALNRVHYGTSVVTDVMARDFRTAYGALARAEPAQTMVRGVPVPAEVRRRIYEVSPAFRELEGHLEGEPGRFWASPELGGEIGAAWFLWAFRDAVAAAGHYRSASAASAYYRRLSDEVDDACEQRLLECGPARASLAPAWRGEYLGPVLAAMGRAGSVLVRFTGFGVVVDPSTHLPESGYSVFRRMTLDRLSDGSAGGQRRAVLAGIGRAYQLFTPPLAAAALLAFFASLAACAARWRPPALLCVSAALGLAVLVRLALLAYLDVTSFPTINFLYLAPAFPLMLLFCAVAVLDGIAAVRTLARADRRPTAAPPAGAPG